MDGTIKPHITESVRRQFGPRMRFDEPLSRHTSFRIGGPADIWVEVLTTSEIAALQRFAAASGRPLVVLGTGTNVLVSDQGIRGLVIKLGRPFGRFTWRNSGPRTRVRAGAAAPFKKLVVEAGRRGLSGLEFAEGIPGTIGGGLLMNAGAFGGEIADVVDGVTGVGPTNGVQHLPVEALRFGYRRFDLPDEVVVTQVGFVLAPGDPKVVQSRVAKAKRQRGTKQPLGWPNAGSIFKNPAGDFAGRLIEEVGLKGRRIGGAMVSDRHANFIVNVGEATAMDVKQLMDEIIDAVWQAEAVRLVPEIKLVGDWEMAR